MVRPATIHEDLRGRDFTINSIALSLNPASRGLLLDPNNGVGDLERKELRAVSNYTLYDDPIRLLRVLRFKVRLSFNIDERTKMQYDNAREAQLETRIPPQDLLEELRHIANEPNCADVIQLLEDEKLLQLYSPALAGGKAAHAGSSKAAKGPADDPLRRRHSSGKHGRVSLFPDRKTFGQGPCRVREGRWFNAEGSRAVAEAGIQGQEAGKGFEVGQAAEAFAGLFRALESAG